MENSKNKYSIDPAIMQAVIEQGPDFMLELFRLMMNQAMKAERESHLNASSYERTPERSGYANGFKPKTLNLRAGRVDAKGEEHPRKAVRTGGQLHTGIRGRKEHG